MYAWVLFRVSDAMRALPRTREVTLLQIDVARLCSSVGVSKLGGGH